MERTQVIGKIVSLVLSNQQEELKTHKEIIAKLTNTATAKEGLKNAIEMGQRGYQVSDLMKYVVAVATRKESAIKSLACYFIVNYGNITADLLHRIEEAFFANFVSHPPKLKRSILCGILPLLPYDNILCYLYDLKQACIDDDAVIRRSVPIALRNIEAIHPGIIASNCLGSLLKRLLWDEEPFIQASTIDCLRKMNLRIITVDELYEIILDFYSVGYAYGICSALRMLETMNLTGYSKMLCHLLERLVKSTDSSVFYRSSLLLYRLDKKSAEYILDHFAGFMNLRHEQLYNMLVFAKIFMSQLPQHVCAGFVSSSLVIYDSDPDYIAEAKLQVLGKIKTSNSIREIARSLVGNYREKAIRVCIQERICLEEILRNSTLSEKHLIVHYLAKAPSNTVDDKEIIQFLESWGEEITGDDFFQAALNSSSTILICIRNMKKERYFKQLLWYYCGFLHKKLLEVNSILKGTKEHDEILVSISSLLSYFYTLSVNDSDTAFRVMFDSKESSRLH